MPFEQLVFAGRSAVANRAHIGVSLCGRRTSGYRLVEPPQILSVQFDLDGVEESKGTHAGKFKALDQYFGGAHSRHYSIGSMQAVRQVDCVLSGQHPTITGRSSMVARAAASSLGTAAWVIDPDSKSCSNMPDAPGAGNNLPFGASANH